MGADDKHAQTEQQRAPTLQTGQVGILGFGFQEMREASVSVAKTTTLRKREMKVSRAGGRQTAQQQKH